jgi:adenylate cyclase, class 2
LEAEVELKYEVPDFDQTIARLKKSGAELVHPFTGETNTVLDRSEGELFRSGRLLRIRSYAGRTILTVKGPCLPGPMKSRVEHETTLACGVEKAVALLKELGFVPVYSYRKRREEWSFGPGAIVCLDELSFGCFVEVEANSHEKVEELSELLGFSVIDGISASYRELELFRGQGCNF